MPSPQERLRAKFAELCIIAQEKYGVDCTKVPISFELKGAVAGYASCKGGFLNRHSFKLRFNYDLLMRETDEMVDETLPHELAHIVCFMKPALGRNHDIGWQRVCIALGGDASRTHDMDVVYGKGYTYEYKTTNGQTVRIGDRHHARVLAGETISFKKNKGKIMKGCAYSVVGCQGRSYPTPVVRNAEHNPIVLQPVHVPVSLRGFGTLGGFVKTVVPARGEWTKAVTPLVVNPMPLLPPNASMADIGAAARALALPGESKADTARRFMVHGYRRGDTYETVLKAVMLANSHNRNLAASYLKNNAAKCGVPQSWLGA